MREVKENRGKIEDQTHEVTPLFGQMFYADGRTEVPKLRGYAAELYKGAVLRETYKFYNQE